MIDQLIANTESSEQNILYDKPKSWAIDYYIIDIYNGKIDQPLQKFWFYIPKAKVFDINDNSIRLALTNTDQDTKLINYIENLENNIFSHIKKKFLNTVRKINRTFLKSKLFTPVIKLDYTRDTVFFNESDDEIALSSNHLNQNDMVGIYLELNNVLTSGNEMWAMWKILQLKKLEGVNLRKSFFKPTNPPLFSLQHKDTNISNIPPPPPCMIPPINNIPHIFIPKIEIKKTSIESPPQNTPKSTSFTISESDIKNQIGRLRKINTEKKEEKDDPITDMVYKTEELKKVETKLMKPSEWYSTCVETETICNVLENCNNDDAETFLSNINKILQMSNNKMKNINNMYNDVVNSFTYQNNTP